MFEHYMFSTSPPSPISGTMLEDKGYWLLNIVLEGGGCSCSYWKTLYFGYIRGKRVCYVVIERKKWLAQRLPCMEDPCSRAAFMTFVTVLFLTGFPWKHWKTANFRPRIKCYRLYFSLKSLIWKVNGIWNVFKGKYNGNNGHNGHKNTLKGTRCITFNI